MLFIGVAAIYALMTFGAANDDNPRRRTAETYRLVHAIGNTERINSQGLSKAECERRKGEMKIIVTTLGTGGSVTCLPDSMFDD